MQKYMIQVWTLVILFQLSTNFGGHWTRHKQLHNTHKVVKQYAWRWDKSNLDYYYHGTNNNLNAVIIPDLWECDTYWQLLLLR